ncbi:MAG TPA: PspC domain-containing protein [Coriobacteriia bacterium]|nr:PspC domain-containing protein [Coriobacteriia bacterium]
MNGNDRRNDWTLVTAVALVVLGAWFLMRNIFGDVWAETIGRAMKLAWPVGLIALGVMLLVASKSARSTSGGKRLYRSREKMIGGVLGGVADYFGVDPTIVRVLYVVFAFLTSFGPAVVAYIIAMIVIPEEPAGGPVSSPSWPDIGGTTVSTPPNPHYGWPHSAGTETVQTPPAPEPPSAPAPPAAPEPPASDAPSATQGE